MKFLYMATVLQLLSENTKMTNLDSDESKFDIQVNSNKYTVTAYCNEGHCSSFKIETNCEYLFTLYPDEEGHWNVEKDVTVLDESLIEQIGRAIEEHDAV